MAPRAHSRKRSRAAAAVLFLSAGADAWISPGLGAVKASSGSRAFTNRPAASTAVDPRSGLFGFREQLSPMSAVATATRPLTTVASQVLSRSVPHTVPRFRPDDDYSLDSITRHLAIDSKADVARALHLLSLVASPAQQLFARETSEMVAEACGDRDVVLAAILFQAVQDGRISAADVKNEMGANVAALTQNSAEIIQLQSDSRELLWNTDQAPLSRISPSQAENLGNMLITMSADWRVVTLALVHHVRHTRTLTEGCGTEAALATETETAAIRTRTREAFVAAREALDVYAPLAHRLGMNQLKNDLENLGFKHLYPQQHQLITEQLAERAEKHEVLLSEQLLVLKRVLQEDTLFMNNIDHVVVEGRQKSPYSTWRKLLKISEGARLSTSSLADTNAIDQVLDAIALRVVLKPDAQAAATRPAERGEALCYHVLELVHEQWAHMDFRVKDYLAEPKENGYQALHTTCTMRYHGVVYPFEVQVRTQDMHRVAEWGKAAHFRYKEAGDGRTAMEGLSDEQLAANAEEAAPLQWLLHDPTVQVSNYLDSLDKSEPTVEVTDPIARPAAPVGSACEYANRLHDELQEQRVYVFGSDGNILDLKRGVTVQEALLFGDRPGGVTAEGSFRVNGRLARPDYELKNGDHLMAA
uniref:RelA/SpoT domain-containing protein n=1 Tax=Florenciella parvula TaxID=236787 RepID=A0A7S2C5L2_9STRA|eukprot:CAMPEP_0182532844 /NCGR_PEP_ID=MMETSP1323-20130603/12466_1 /TAXON_ID=236787 /ORGANISM="Florenciella parvula, Strain RCC1693" /LENGTH=644 /DNA_ID=CAMNT_0024742645 /DNA_START=191 /DNA_END=2125 /DNA_ORIENTATION=+